MRSNNNSTQRQTTIHTIKYKEKIQRSAKQRNISVKGPAIDSIDMRHACYSYST